MTGQVAQAREGYYSAAVDSGEPAGQWYGAGAEQLGLRDEVDADLLEAIYQHRLDPRDPRTHDKGTWWDAPTVGSKPRAYRTPEQLYAEALAEEPAAGPERRAELRRQAERHAQQNVAFTDFTFSPQKSITVAAVAFERAANQARTAGRLVEAAEWDARHRAVEDAVMAGARASIDYLEAHAAFARRGKHGGGQGKWIDAPNLTVAQFLQHDSRDHDPQLHVHQAIWNQVRGSDGRYTAIDGRALRAMRGAAEAVGGRVMEAQLSAVLGWRFVARPDGVREVAGVSRELCESMSRRDRAITGKTAELVAAYVERFGRQPPLPVLNRMKQTATMATRSAKSHDGETQTQRLDRWERESRDAVAGGLSAVAHGLVADSRDNQPATRFSQAAVVERAVAAIGEKRSTWSRSDVMREIGEALPANLGIPAVRIPALLDRLTAEALRIVRSVKPANPNTVPTPEGLRRADGQSVFDAPVGERYVTPGQVWAERTLRAAAVRRGAFAVSVEAANALVERFAQAGCELGADQAAAVRGVLTSGAQVEVMAAAAGAGKSFVVGAIAQAFAARGRTVFGLAPSQVAADVLADEGVTAANVDRWIRTQVRIEEGRGCESDSQYQLRPGDLVVVDEAGMAATGQLVEVHRRCESAGAKLLLVGDPRQLGAVGPGGALADVAEHGLRYELTEVRRFTAPWERTASLGLRDGDPAALDEYQKHGRLLACGAVEQAEQSALRAWLADTLAGKQSVLIAATNEAAARLSAQARDELGRMGKVDVDTPGVALGRDGNTAGVGDLVQARRNAWDLADSGGRAAVNRATYRVQQVTDSGGMVVRPLVGRDVLGEVLGEPLTLPAEYVQANLTLGYASTVHAAQGRTLDTCHAVLSEAVQAPAAYVALTRGREANTAHVVTRTANTDNPAGEVQAVEPRAARAVLAGVFERDTQDRSALQQIEDAEEETASTLTNVGQLLSIIGDITAGHTSSVLDRLEAEGVLSADDRVRLAADTATGAVDRILRSAELAGHDRDQVLRDAVARGDLTDARSPGQVLYARVQDAVKDTLAPEIASFRDLLPATVPDDVAEWLAGQADVSDDRRRELGSRAADDTPAWAVEALGPVPDDILERADWEQRAGWAAAYREMAEHDDDTDALGSAPPAGLADKYAIWRTAHQALGLPDRGPDEREMTDGQLRNRVEAFERERVWAPRYVADELAETERQRNARLVDAELWESRAAQLADPAEALELRTAAEEARREAAGMAPIAAELDEADSARASWVAATAVTAEYAERAKAELGARGVDLDDDSDQVTAEEWLTAQEEAQARDDARRYLPADEIATDEITDAAAAVVDPDEASETAVPDIREVTLIDDTETSDPDPRDRVPTVDEAEDAVVRARDAVTEIANRAVLDERVDGHPADEADEDVEGDEQYVDDRRDNADEFADS